MSSEHYAKWIGGVGAAPFGVKDRDSCATRATPDLGLAAVVVSPLVHSA
jgi:hypothetical protein